jgi:hypothetical protein
MAVTIDIPGVGNVEAKNAASEATLLQILAAMKANTKALGRLGKGDGGGGGPIKEIKEEIAARTRSSSMLGKFANSIGHAAAVTTIVTTKFGELASGTANLMSSMSNIGDGVENAASAMNSIPIVGGVLSSVFGAVAGAATKSVGAFQQAASSGATFGGSINEFAKSASAAGMTMADFAGLIAKNGESLRLLGGNTADGAARFATLTKEMRSSGVMKSLNDLGYSTSEVNQGMANYMKTTMQGGRNSNMTNAQLVQGTKKYLKEMDMLAKVTGETRAQQEEAQAKLASDAQYQAAMAGMSETVAASFRDTVTGLPGPLRDVAKDIMATGTATTEESQKFTAMMPKSAAMMQDFAAKTQRGEKISQEERNKLNNLMAEEGKQAASQYKDIGRYSKEFATQTNQFTAAANIGKDALKNAAASQDAATAGADGQAAALEKSKQTLAEFSNKMTMALANSGLLDTLMTVFGALASFVTNVVVPIFQMLAPVISNVATIIADNLVPVFDTISGVIKDYVIPGFQKVVDFVQDNFIPILVGGGVILGTALASLAVGAIGAAASLLLTAAPAIAVGAAIALLVKYFVNMGGSVSVLSDALSLMKKNLEGFFVNLKAGFFGLLNKIPGFRGDFDADLKELEAEQTRIAQEKAALETKISTEMEANRNKNAADAKKKEDERAARDKKYAEAKYGEEKKAIDKKAEAEAPKASVDYSGPEAMLKSFANQQKVDYSKIGAADGTFKVDPKKFQDSTGTPVAKAESVRADLKPPNATAGAEATKNSMTADEKEKVALKRAAAAQDAEEAAKKAGKGGSPAPQSGTPTETAQSTTDSLLKELNTNMVALLRATRENNRIAEKQLSAQESMGGDLFSNVAA